MTAQVSIFIILFCTLGLFIWGKLRFDLVALCALLTAALLKLIPEQEVFSGFGHPAVITVAAVLVISKALQNSGLIDAIAARILDTTQKPLMVTIGLTAFGALISGFMNNVGALALLMPIALHIATRAKIPLALILMPLSFGTILGGLTTMIGTPPNIIVATYRTQLNGNPFTLFDFTPVGASIALAGVLFISLVGWRLIPKARHGKKTPADFFEINDYIVEVRVKKDSISIGLSVAELEESSKTDLEIVGMLRAQQRLMVKTRIANLHLQDKDILLLKTDPSNLQSFIEKTELELVGEVSLQESDLKSDEVSVIEAVVAPGTRLEKRSFQSLRLRARYGIALLGISRQGKAFKKRLNQVVLRAGDVLLVQGETQSLAENLNRLGCLQLAERGLQIGPRPKALWPLLIFSGAIALTATGLLSVHLAFSLAIALLILFNLISMRDAYEAIDWPIILLLAAMIPLGQALESSGATALITDHISALSVYVHPVVILILIMAVTMTLSDIMNNAATAVIMAPIAAGIAMQLQLNTDAFLMAVAIGASCAFLTPIGHQNNVLVMGPGGYQFGDYWRVGLPLEILIIIISTPLICLIWPLHSPL